MEMGELGGIFFLRIYTVILFMLFIVYLATENNRLKFNTSS